MNTIILMIYLERIYLFFLEMKEMKDIVVTDGRRSSIVFHKNQKKTSRTETTMDVFINHQSIKKAAQLSKISMKSMNMKDEKISN